MQKSGAVPAVSYNAATHLDDTTTSSYITLADVKKLVLDNVDFKVEDAKTKDDLTRSILMQIILDEESGEGAPAPARGR